MQTLKHLVKIHNSRFDANEQHRRLTKNVEHNLAKNIRKNYPVSHKYYSLNGKLYLHKPKDKTAKLKTYKSNVYDYSEFIKQYKIISKSNYKNIKARLSKDKAKISSLSSVIDSLKSGNKDKQSSSQNSNSDRNSQDGAFETTPNGNIILPDNN